MDSSFEGPARFGCAAETGRFHVYCHLRYGILSPWVLSVFLYATIVPVIDHSTPGPRLTVTATARLATEGRDYRQVTSCSYNIVIKITYMGESFTESERTMSSQMRTIERQVEPISNDDPVSDDPAVTTQNSKRTRLTAAASNAETDARTLAETLCRGFRRHDRRERGRCLDAFATVDRHQFPALTDAAARDAAAGYVDALWEKDALERRYTRDGTLDRNALAAADWSPVQAALERRAEVAGIEPAYAALTTAGWRAHKTGGDYRTPLGKARVYELQIALDDPTYPRKSGDGAAGIGAPAARYLLAVELHDVHTEAAWQQAVAVMAPYFEAILARGGDRQ